MIQAAKEAGEQGVATLVFIPPTLAGGEVLLLGDPLNFVIEPRVALFCSQVSTRSEGGRALEVGTACDRQLIGT